MLLGFSDEIIFFMWTFVTELYIAPTDILYTGILRPFCLVEQHLTIEAMVLGSIPLLGYN